MRFILLFFLIVLSVKAMGRQCSCEDNFRHMMDKMKHNYSGFNDKVTDLNRREYERFTDSLLIQTRNADVSTCLQLMSAWMDFFKDGHVSVALIEDSANHALIRGLYRNTERVTFTQAQFRSYLSRSKQQLDPLEGIWEDESGLYLIGIIRKRGKHAGELTGFVLQADSLFWMPGQIKMKLEDKARKYRITAYYNRMHTVSVPEFKIIRDGVFYIAGYGNWYKQYPGGGKKIIAPDASGGAYHPSLKILDDKTCLVAIPNAQLTYKGEIDSLLTRYDADIKQREHLIIDVRDNGGGSVLCFEKLLPLIYTRPIITKGASVLATEDNIKGYYAMYDFPNISDSMKDVFKKEAEVLWVHRGGMYNLWPGDTTRFDTVFPYPQKVSILINGNCASSTELFLIKARQSGKVTMYGTATLGVVDYADAATFKLPCDIYKVRFSTSRTNRLPDEKIDNIGIQPDVKISGQVPDWVEYVRTL
jgi:hypothetical protein